MLAITFANAGDAVVITEDGEFAASFGKIATLAAANWLASVGLKNMRKLEGLIGYGELAWPVSSRGLLCG
jgi:hypothetical protein